MAYTFETQTTSVEQVFGFLERANTIATTTKLDVLLDRMLGLIIEIAGGKAGTLYLVEGNEVIFQVVHGDEKSQQLVGRRQPISAGIVGATAQSKKPIWIDDFMSDPRWESSSGTMTNKTMTSLLSLPLLQEEELIGVIQVFNPTHHDWQLLQLLGNRMASEVQKARLLKATKQRESRLAALVEIIGHIGSTLDRETLLNMIMNYGRTLLNTEASSLFLCDEATGELVLHVSTGRLHEKVQSTRIPKGKGIAGSVVETGKTVVVNNTETDTRHYIAVDQQSGFRTRAILAVPLRTRTITFGRNREQSEEHIIGCIEALNKCDGDFDCDDVQLFETLARQAATVLEIANLYADMNELFFDVIQSLTAAIDAKDPYTEGHSQRVAQFSVIIAQHMDVPSEFIHHLQIGAILHDVGKIGVSDSVLKKPDRLTDAEYAEMKLHPTIGQNILGHIRMLQHEMPMILEHHERLDGSGYPQNLKYEEISLGGRIVAVADAFDAMTSDRPYRKGLPVTEAFSRLQNGIGKEFDPECVAALLSAYDQGLIQVQK